MDPINNTVAGLMDLFNKRMAQFEAQLQREPAEPSNTSNLAAEFFSFRVFITQAVTTLQQQVELLARNIDSMEMRGRRGILLLHGVPEDKEEDAAQLVVDVVRDRLKVNIGTLKPQDAMKFPIEPEIVDTPQKPIIAGRSKRAAAIKK
ncbi:hypothetical protein HF086_005157 [Spodoptera exigua]|uniref:Uncharacterized protein n=1 Tax=Spodoptera exigua TaxID=7107 RepID=A0A922MR32_SPOEX|nr:hypothetical protein HF086_008433 [Spodoptera exigua]KAH9641711.1 hypothetical protein HF086_005157 [Spodoptera exigua]